MILPPGFRPFIVSHGFAAFSSASADYGRRHKGSSVLCDDSAGSFEHLIRQRDGRSYLRNGPLMAEL
jgi:hypothetical protein